MASKSGATSSAPRRRGRPSITADTRTPTKTPDVATTPSGQRISGRTRRLNIKGEAVPGRSRCRHTRPLPSQPCDGLEACPKPTIWELRRAGTRGLDLGLLSLSPGAAQASTLYPRKSSCRPGLNAWRTHPACRHRAVRGRSPAQVHLDSVAQGRHPAGPQERCL